MNFRFTVDSFPDENFEAEVRLIDPMVDPKTHTVQVRALMENPDLKLRPGMFLRGALVSGEQEKVIMVPAEAIAPREGDNAIAIVERDGKAFRVEVQTGQRYDKNIEIKQGLSEGDVIVLEQLGSLNDGDPIEAVLPPAEQ